MANRRLLRRRAATTGPAGEDGTLHEGAGVRHRLRPQPRPRLRLRRADRSGRANRSRRGTGPGGEPARAGEPVPAGGPVRNDPADAEQSSPAGQNRPRLGELLVRAGRLTPAQVDEALLQQSTSGKRLGALLIELGMVDERSLIEALSVQLDVPVADLRQSEPDPEAAARVPEALARSLGVVAVRRSEGRC
ncbi:hypothetical protein O1L60_41330 [Streptomyces diastatochromogenes]|nr:hypothetical protein [Streptomyces diastatochromogenes]